MQTSGVQLCFKINYRTKGSKKYLCNYESERVTDEYLLCHGMPLGQFFMCNCGRDRTEPQSWAKELSYKFQLIIIKRFGKWSCTGFKIISAC